MEIKILVWLLLLMQTDVKCEIFTSMASMEYLVYTEKHLLSNLKNYIKNEEEKLASLKKFMSRVDHALEYVNDTDIGKYLGNPVNSYLMLRRFNFDWMNIGKMITLDHAEDFAAAYDEMRPYFPSEEDYQGAMTALLRLQDTYKLSSNKLSQGILPGVPQLSQQSLATEEVYELGQHAYTQQDYFLSREWMRTTLSLLGNESSILNVKRENVLDYLAFSEFKSGDIWEAFRLTQELARLRPGEKRVLDNLEYFRKELRMSSSTGKRGDTGILDDSAVYERNRIKAATLSEATNRRQRLNSYEQLCRGEIRQLTKREQAKLKCWYKFNDPILRLKPQKIERVWVDPEIFLLREIISDEDIQLIKEAAYPKLSRATIQDPITGQLTYAAYRVSKSAWLCPSQYDFVRRVMIKSEAATNLDMRSSEQLQIANYGIGGHYEPHFDHAREEEDKFSDLGLGNRIATILFYLSNVEAGGATAFTIGRTAVFPSKGDAVFWYNLRRNGTGNSRTRHAACPVLVGQKWVANLWVHEYGQEFRRKCALNRNW